MSDTAIAPDRWMVTFPPRRNLAAQTGIVEAIHIGPVRKEPMVAVQEIRAIPGLGLEGDRYHKHAGSFSKRLKPERELTLIEAEALEAFAEELGIPFTAQESRRNILTRGIALNDLLEREFTIGGVRLRGIKLCQPCSHLAGLTGKQLRPGLSNRAGINAQILSEGTIRVGDVIHAEKVERVHSA
jgi:MOSC domain-containing protein YiiM